MSNIGEVSVKAPANPRKPHPASQTPLTAMIGLMMSLI